MIYLNKDIFGQTRPQKATSDFLKKLLRDVLQKEKDMGSRKQWIQPGKVIQKNFRTAVQKRAIRPNSGGGG